MAFIRENDDEEILVVLNAGHQDATVTLPLDGTGWTKALGAPDTPPPTVTIPAIGGAVWVRGK